MKYGRLTLLTALLSLIMVSCGPRKNTALSRNYQAFITRYNIYYNGDEHYKETMKSLEDEYEDDYTQLLYIHPTDARKNPDAPQPSGDFTRSVEKAQKAIQLRSIKKKPARKAGKSRDPKYKEWMKREEYNPFLHNAWMMMGRSQYNNGDFLGAASTFYYIAKHFSWLPRTVTEAKLWQARSYCAMNWDYEAENIISKIPEKALVTGDLKGLYNMVYATLLLQSGNPEEAIPYIERTIPHSSAAQKSRLYFLLGQLQARKGNRKAAYDAFSKSAGAHTSLRTRLNARIRQSEVFAGSNINSEVKALKRMARLDRYKDYLDQIYYAIGNLYMSKNDTASAVKNFILAAEKSTRNGIDKAISQLRLGSIYFDRRQYDLAQPCYSEAVPLLPSNYPGYDSIRLRSDVLDKLAIYTQNVNLNDSLLRLASMTEEARGKVIARIIDELKKKEKEEAENARREEYLASAAANGNRFEQNNAAGTPMSFNINTDDSWYFYNTAVKNAGKTDFQKRWGSRKLEDNWRRRNKSSFDFQEFESDSSDRENNDSEKSQEDTGNEEKSESNEKLSHENDPHFPEYYLKQIPFTAEEQLNCNDIIQESMYNIGLILKDDLEDFPGAEDEWTRLLTRYPDNIYRLDIYYNLYLIFMRLGDTVKAEHYRQLILTHFSESKYGEALRDPNYIDNLRNMSIVQEQMYDKAFEAYIGNDNQQVHAIYNEVRKKYPTSDIMPKFMFIEAMSYVTENNTEKFRSTLTELLERYPDTDVTPLASSYLKGLAQGRQLQKGIGNVRGIIWSQRLSNDSTITESDSVTFDLNPDVPQLLILTYPTDKVSGNELLFNVARHNFSSFVIKDFDLEPMNFGTLGLLVIKGFANFDELVHYRSVMKSDESFSLPPEVRPIMISEKNFETLLLEGRAFEDYFRYIDQKASEDPVESGPGEVEKDDYLEMLNNDNSTDTEEIFDIDESINELPDEL